MLTNIWWKRKLSNTVSPQKRRGADGADQYFKLRVQWCQGLVVVVKEKKNGKHKVRIKWNEAYVREGGGDPTVTEETLLKTY